MTAAEELNQSLELLPYKNYFIREDGAVFTRNMQMIKPVLVTNRNGRRYHKVHLYTGDGSSRGGREIWFLHRLLAWVFLGPFIDNFSDLVVDHIDNDSLNCSIWNIEIMTQQGNVRRRREEFSSIPF